jgi:hypothetical protein
VLSSPPSSPPSSTPRTFTALLFLTVVGIFLGLQVQGGGFSSDLGGDPDEAAHAVTSLMVRDYLWQAPGRSPIAFASDYYEAFPKVALGHYPPGYYLTAAAALSLGCDSRSLIILQALLLGTLAVAGWIFARRWITQGDNVLALCPAILLLFHTEIIRVGCHVLADLQLAVLVFGALWAWHTYLRSPGWRPSLCFGLLAAAAILTKGSAVGLAGVPVLSLLLGRRVADLKKLHWWGSALPVLFLAGPWMVYSIRFTQEGFIAQSPLAYLVDALHYYGETLPRVYGWPLLLLLIVSLLRLLRDTLLHRSADPTRVILWAGWISMQILVMVIPTGFSPRYLIPGLLPGLLLILIEARHGLIATFARSASAPATTVGLRAAVLALTICTVFLTRNDRPKTVSGFSETVHRLLRESPDRAKQVWLVSSDPRGEGAVIAEAAFRTPDRTRGALVVHRGTKALVDTDWVGKTYQSRFSDSRSLLNILDQLQIDTVMVDLSMDPTLVAAHESALKADLESPNSGWKLSWRQTITRTFGPVHGDLWVFRRTPT